MSSQQFPKDISQGEVGVEETVPVEEILRSELPLPIQVERHHISQQTQLKNNLSSSSLQLVENLHMSEL